MATIYGNRYHNNINGTFYADKIYGVGGNDTLDGRQNNDTLNGGQNNDLLFGAGGNDILLGADGDDILSGGTGADTMQGGTGNDFSFVDNLGDVVTEGLGAGIDEVNSTVSFKLRANVERLSLSGSSPTNGTGNNQDNHITGNDANNTLNGFSGADTLVGNGGNDTYVVDNPRDVTSEKASSGTDKVNSSVTWNLGANLENLFLTGGAAINGNGNGVDNKIVGNIGNNVLNGKSGHDSLAGSGGADTLNGANNGSFGKNEIDTLTGGTGGDRFVLGLAFGQLYDNIVGNNPGRGDYALITDFNRFQNDRLQLDGNASQYLLGASPVSGVSGTALYHDSNGNGTLQSRGDELIAIIRSPTALTADNTINTAVFV